MIRPSFQPLPKAYEPGQFETEIYQFWEKERCFEAADHCAPGQKPFAIMIPPPNVTGALHMGHALTNTIQDILTRWHRMKGDNTLWLPGTDHAGIATQTQVEKQVAKERGPNGKPLTRHDLGREKFLERVWEWKNEHGGKITRQLRSLGASLDWSRERFTLDEGCSAAVREVFVSLYEKGLIYRGERLINWSPLAQTALSDLEVIPTEKKGHLWHIRYRIVEPNGSPVFVADGSPAELVVATTRPETLLGDTAVAIHPEDERYRSFHGKMAVVPLCNRKIPVILDSYVDREFGTGSLKVTPAHDFNDNEIGKRHSLPLISVIDKHGRMNSAAGRPYEGMLVADARIEVVKHLEEQGLLVNVEPITHRVGLCQRTGCVAEPLLSLQWFVKIEPLATPALKAVEEGRITFTPEHWTKTYYEWMRNIQDWCISRQLWWGHQIPAWYCSSCQEMTVSREAPRSCPKCKAPANSLKQDEDVLDTWFSSALWPFSTLGWPEKTPALQTFYPNTIMETGFDIIFFWVARMIMMGMHFMGDIPFSKVYLHTLVRDEKGEKMSKTKGNVIDPLDVLSEHGVDAMRFTLATLAGQGRDIKLSIDRVEDYRTFCNKLWNAAKFFLMQLEEAQGGAVAEPQEGAEAWLKANFSKLKPEHQWILSRLQDLIPTVNRSLEQFELNVGAQALYDFTWNEFCGWSIEFAKLRLKQGKTEREEALVVLHYVLDQVLRLLHPFMPFATEALWQQLPWKKMADTASRQTLGLKPIQTLMLQAWPRSLTELRSVTAEKRMSEVKNIVLAIRNFKGESNLSPKTEFDVTYFAHAGGESEQWLVNREQIQTLTRIKSIRAGSPGAAPAAYETVIPLIEPAIELRIDLRGLVNVDEELKRVQKEIDKVKGDLDFVTNKLSREDFMAKAPPQLVEKERGREREFRAKLEELEKSRARFQSMGNKS